MNKNERQGLIGKLIYDVFGQVEIKNLRDIANSSEQPRVYFCLHWLEVLKPGNEKEYTEKSLNQCLSSITKYDCFEGKMRKNVIARIENEEKFECDIQTELDKLKLDRQVIIKRMIDALDTTIDFKTSRTEQALHEYDETAKKRLINYFKCANELLGRKLSHYIRWYIYFAIYNSVPKDFSENARSKRDLEEFTDCVIKKYGMVSKHAIREIVKLAEREPNPNIIALYEYSDLCYYGNAEGIKQDINKAFEIAKKAAGIEYDGHIDNAYDAHPLALWSLADICLNYKRSEVPVYNSGTIFDIEGKCFLDRIKLAYKYAHLAYVISKLPAAANTLGVIARYTDADPECKGVEAFRTKEGMSSDYVKWFKDAAEGGYVYAYNNLATEELRLFIKEIDNPTERNKHRNQYIDCLNQAASQGEPWAACKLGRIYRNGITRRTNDSEEVIDSSIIDHDKAYDYFKMSYLIYHKFYDEACAWAGANLIKYYFDKLSDEEIADINTIIDKYSYRTDLLEFVSGMKNKVM